MIQFNDCTANIKFLLGNCLKMISIVIKMRNRIHCLCPHRQLLLFVRTQTAGEDSVNDCTANIKFLLGMGEALIDIYSAEL